LVSEYINKSASTIDWLEEMGVEFVDVIAYVQGSQFTHHVVKGAGGRPGPQASAIIMKRITERATELGVKIYLQTPVTKIIKEGDKIIGLMAKDKNGEEIKVKAKAVIIATGDFGDNPEWIEKYTGYKWGKDLFSFRIPGLTGEGIQMAWDVGAGRDLMNMELTCAMPAESLEEDQKRIMSGNFTLLLAMGLFRQPNLLVNLKGARFMDESIAGNPTFFGNAVARQKHRVGFVICDGAIVKEYEQAGGGFGRMMGGRPMKLTDMPGKLEQAAKETPHIFIADTLDELAAKTGIDPVGLKKTVEEYNKVAETGRDNIFHKPARYLKPIRTPKFYAGRFYPTAYGSLGGIKINHLTEVVTQDEDTIPGLYAAGVDANAIYGDSYVFIMPGNTMGFALNTGRIAAENAVKYALGK
jgi:fumarate reductase flavoprotein subunit